VVRGEPGVGKTVLLDYLAGRASGRRGPGHWPAVIAEQHRAMP
jgi:hypothetical protein